MIKRGVDEVDIFLAQPVFGQTQTFAEPLEVYDLPLPQEFDDIVHVRIITEAKNVVVGDTGFLLWCDLVRTTFFVDGIGFLYVVCYYVDRSSNMSKLHLKGI